MYWIVLAIYFAQAAPPPAELCASHAKPELGRRFEKPAFKGVELYGWKAEWWRLLLQSVLGHQPKERGT